MYGLLFQAGRTALGTAGMGGNGQLNRLSALDSVADVAAGGPWRDRLTEDQDLGLRLLEAGWRCVSEARVSVNQQGVPDVRRLLRQRTRWAQGNLQAMSHLRSAWGVRRSLVGATRSRRVPPAAGVPGRDRRRIRVSIVLAVIGVAAFWGDDGWLQLAFFFVLGLRWCRPRLHRQGRSGRRARDPPGHRRRADLRGVLVADLARPDPCRGTPARPSPRLGEDSARADHQDLRPPSTQRHEHAAIVAAERCQLPRAGVAPTASWRSARGRSARPSRPRRPRWRNA